MTSAQEPIHSADPASTIAPTTVTTSPPIVDVSVTGRPVAIRARPTRTPNPAHRRRWVRFRRPVRFRASRGSEERSASLTSSRACWSARDSVTAATEPVRGGKREGMWASGTSEGSKEEDERPWSASTCSRICSNRRGRSVPGRLNPSCCHRACRSRSCQTNGWLKRRPSGPNLGMHTDDAGLPADS